jgi:hypothetical protein
MRQLLPAEQESLNRVVRVALQDREVQRRLLAHDGSLKAEYGIADHTWQLLCQIQAKNLEDFCSCLYGRQKKD